MSSGDPLDRMVRALREEGETPAPQAKLTRERIMRDLRPKARSRKWTWAIPVAALLAGSTVLAATGQLPAIVKSAKDLIWREPTPLPANTHATSSATRTTAAVETPKPPEPAPAVTEEPPAPAVAEEPPAVAAPRSAKVEARPEPSTRSTPSASARVVEAAPSSPVPPPADSAVASAASVAPAPAVETDDALSLYRHAHHLYFTEQNPGAALVAFDEYLAKNPKSPLVVDARYDRALCLVRLGRHDEARTALQPFADGRYGAYRQKDAKRLLDAMPSK